MQKIVNGEAVEMTQEEIAEFLAWSEQNVKNSRIEVARDTRNALLAATDWAQAADVPQATKDKWAPYRQALRDVPQQPGFPENIQWPVKPE